jgi:small conductance mechanosensitive channel
MAVGFVYALEWLGIPIGLVVGGLGIAGIALAFALQDILENFIAGVLLQIQRPFTYGDQIHVNGHDGTAQTINTRLTTILTPDGEIVKIPSATVIKSDITNYTQQSSRRTTLPVGVAYGTDLREAQRVLLDAVARAEGVLSSRQPEAYLEAFGDSSIDFAVRFWHKPAIADFWATRSEVAFEVEAALAEAGITIPSRSAPCGGRATPTSEDRFRRVR